MFCKVYEEVVVVRRFRRAVQRTLLRHHPDRFVRHLQAIWAADLSTDHFPFATSGSAYVAGTISHL